MASPISNNNPALIDHRRAGNANDESATNGNKAATGNEQPAARRQDDAISVSNAAHALGSSVSNQNNGNIQSASQASDVAKNIASFFAENGAGALTAHGNGTAGLANLLKAG
ncbi:hypothetical protein MNBD_GAMMA17-1627 [hydrothermal vent metagenome]|uniref:Uncharacterized protein n=1 Tax=hydrothermal vent metagenome TaxID=652676 RepID=A0A3B0ZER8_9ZZZZ